MATTLIIKKTNELDALAALLDNTLVVVSNASGKLFKTTAPTLQQVLPIVKNADFSISLLAGQMLEYIVLDNDASMDILIGTTPGSNNIASLINADTVVDGQPISLMRYCRAAETIYITGVLANTITKIKIS